jgi:serine/threonine protein kinase/Flp pilus assembly protein TadD
VKLSISQTALLSRLLDEALPLDAAARRAWLERLAPEHHELAEALRRALSDDSRAAASNIPEAPPKLHRPAEALDRAEAALHAGVRVGPYELIRPLGAGGMAQVWLARRADGAFKREVALKLPTLTHLRADLQQRFARERDILASLEHPHIARFYDAGVDPNGLPYVAMEYVHGEPLTDWCDAHRLRIAARLELFLQVLDAVQYAHTRHVIHRDLKPSNILVTESSQVRLLDFGVAKLLETEEADQTPLTSVYGRALTPDYASPELLRGDPIDARSDVYSLGVVLYELLTGIRPYRLKSAASMGLLEQAIGTVDVKKPSTRIEPEAVATRATTRERLAHQLRGDLDAIALKALAKDPAERYPSAAAFQNDLHRHLGGKPIEALPARLIYRLQKFVRRNKTPVGVSVTAVAAILATVGYTLYRETTPRSPSIAVLPLTNESGEASQQYFSDGISEDLITALAQFPGLKVIGRTSAFQFRDSKEDSRSIGAKLGVAHLLEGSVRRAGDTVRVSAELIDTADGSTQWSERYDRPYQDLFALQDEITHAVAETLRAKLLPGEHVAVQSDRPPGGSLEAYNAMLQGRFYHFRGTEGDLRKAIEYYTQAIELDPRYALAWSGLARVWAHLGATFLDGAPAQVAYAKSRAAADPALALSPDLAAAHVARGYLLQNADFDWRGAEAEFRRALELAPNDGEAKFFLGNQLATFGEPDRAIELTRQVLTTEPLRANWYNWLASYLSGLNRLDEAERAIRTAIELQPTTADFHFTLTIIEVQRGDAQAALAAAQQEAAGAWQDQALALAQQIGADRSAADAALRTLIDRDANASAYQIAEVYALRKDAKATFEWLDRALSNRDAGIRNLLYDPFILRYKDDPRFAAFCRKVDLVPFRPPKRRS